MRTTFKSLLVLLAIVASLFAAYPAAAATQIVGDSSVESFEDNVISGQAEAFKYTSTSSGVAYTMYVYVSNDGGLHSLPQHVQLGVYDNNGSNKPGTLQGVCTITTPSVGWNSCSLAGQAVVLSSSTVYWLAVMAPSGDYTPFYRDTDTGQTTGTTSYVSTGQTLSSIPSSFNASTGYDNTPASIYVMSS